MIRSSTLTVPSFQRPRSRLAFAVSVAVILPCFGSQTR